MFSFFSFSSLALCVAVILFGLQYEFQWLSFKLMFYRFPILRASPYPSTSDSEHIFLFRRQLSSRTSMHYKIENVCSESEIARLELIMKSEDKNGNKSAREKIKMFARKNVQSR